MTNYNDSGGSENPEYRIIPLQEGLSFHREGVLYVQQEPLYYIRHFQDADGGQYVTVYKALSSKQGGDKNPQPEYRIATTTTAPFKGDTLLGRVAKQMFPPKKGRKKVVRDLLFLAPVLYDVGTLVGKGDYGFFDRTEDRLTSQGGKQIIIPGEPTGVFIEFRSVTWLTEFQITTKQIMESLQIQNQKMYAGDIYDLEGGAESSSVIENYYSMMGEDDPS